VIISCAIGVLLSACASLTTLKMRIGHNAMKQAWYDAKHEAWEACAVNLSSALQHIREGVNLEPVRQTKAGDVVLTPYLAALESGAWSRLETTVRQRDLPAFEVAYVEAATSCIACHSAAGRNKLRLPKEANIPQ
jgi:hypothetical protein